MAVALNLQLIMDIFETLATGVPAASTAGATIEHANWNQTLALDANTTVPITKTAIFQKALVAGAVTVDLTALTGSNGAAVTLSGLKVQALYLKNPTTNANTIKVKVGAANGYQVAGAAWEVTLSPGQWMVLYGHDLTPDVGGAAKDLDLTGTGTQALDMAIVAG